MLLVEQGCDDGVQTNRLTLTGSTGNEQVRNLRQIHHEHFVGDGLTQRDRQFHLGFLELLGVQDALHAHDVCLGIRHLDTDGSLARDRSDDTDTQGSEAQGDIILQVLDLGDAHTLGRLNLVEGDGRTHGGTDGLDLYAEVAQHLDDPVLVRLLLLFVDRHLLVVVFLQQVEGRVLVSCERLLRIDRRIEHLGIAYGVAGSLLLSGSHRDIHSDMSRSGSGCSHLLALSFCALCSELTLLLNQARSCHVLIGISLLAVIGRGSIEVDWRGSLLVSVLLLLVHLLLQRTFLVLVSPLVRSCLPSLRILGVLVHLILLILYRTLGSIPVSFIDGIILLLLLLMVGNLEFHLIRYIADRIESLSHDGDGLGGDIGEECDRHEEKDGGESRRTDDILQGLDHKHAVLSAGIEDETTEDRSEELGEGDG